jgi:hypothetical protein
MTDVDKMALTGTRVFQKRNIAWIRPYAFISAVYILASWLTRPFFQGDTFDYVDSILAKLNGRYLEFWEFGHLLWRPIGWLAFRFSSPLLAQFVGPNQRNQVTIILTALSWVAGLASALLLLALLRLYCIYGWASYLIATLSIFSMAILDYSRTGCSYISGLALLLLGMYLVAREATRPVRSLAVQVWAGLVLAGSVSLWFLYVLAVPAAVLLPFMSGKPDKARFRLSIATFLSFCLSIASAYAGVLIHLRLFSTADILSWILASSHGISMGGISRAIFGWPRSIMYMGDAGRIMKRYLLHDPYNAGSARDLLQLWPELIKMGLFYTTLFAVIFNLRRSSDGRRALAFGMVSALPVLGFAVHWTGGAFERYLPLCPVFFLILSISITDIEALSWTKMIALLFVVCAILTNAIGLRNGAARLAETKAEYRVHELVPQLKPGSSVIVSHNLDDLMEFNSNFPFSPVNIPNTVRLYSLLTAGNSDVMRWRENFTSRAVLTWRAGGDVWISNRLLHQTPQADWNWVEGDDNRVSWSDFYRFFSRMRYGQSVGGNDGFVLLLPSTDNRRNLAEFETDQPNLFPATVQIQHSLPRQEAGLGLGN